MNNEEEIKEGRINTMENVILNNKLECPVVGIGTFMLSPADAKSSLRKHIRKARQNPSVSPISRESI